MRTTDRIKKMLADAPYGITAGEVAKKLRIQEKSAANMLEAMVSARRAKKTRAGRTVFFGSLIFLVLFVSAVSAQNLTSASYKLETVLDSAGGNTTSSNFTFFTSIGQISGRKSSESYELCAGFLCNFLDLIDRGRVTFLLAFNISGSANDEAFVDRFNELRKYTPEELLSYYTCVQDSSVPGGPVLGLISSGQSLSYIKVSPENSFVIRVSEELPGNKFIIPVTGGNCTVIDTRMSQIAEYGTILQPFMIVDEIINSVELALNYRAFDISGTFDRSGRFKLVIEKNQTNENQIIVRPE